MKLKPFLKLVEIQTKVASVIPFAIGTLVSVYLYGHFNGLNFLLMLGSLLCIDMTTTAINNYMDYQKALHTEGYGYNGHNAIVRDNLDIRSVQRVIMGLFTFATLFGLMLFFYTDWVVLLGGAISFAVGVGYTYGPMPISRTPFGEVVSGVVMGFGILFLAVYIHLPNPDWFLVSWNAAGRLFIELNFFEFARLFVIAVPLMVGIGDIMLANNICDMEEDWNNHRFTLPLSIGKPSALWIFGASYVAVYAVITMGVIIQWLPLGSLLIFLSLPIVYKLTRAFMAQPIKQLNFINAVKNFVVLNLCYGFSWLFMLIVKIN